MAYNTKLCFVPISFRDEILATVIGLFAIELLTLKKTNLMKAKELRIGNLIEENNTETLLIVEGIYKFDDNKFKISTSTFEGISGRKSDLPISTLSPIPLTEEGLVKFGLKKITDDITSNDNHKTTDTEYYSLMDGWIILRANPDSIALCFDMDYSIFTISEILSVHQLQNLYFALTGEELEVKS